MRELWLGREIRRRRLIVPGGRSENIRNRLGIGAIVSPKGKDAVRNSLSYADSLDFVTAVDNLCEGLL